MASEAPLDLSNESNHPVKSKKKKLLMNLNAPLNGTSNNNDSQPINEEANMNQINVNMTIPEQHIPIQPESLIKEAKQSAIKKGKKRKSSAVSDELSNPIQRGKYGLRMLPQQVDYYQAALEDRKIKSSKVETNIKSDEEEQQTNKSPLEKKVVDKVKPLKISVSKVKDDSKASSIKHEPAIGDIVWATLSNYKVWFPALIISNVHCKQKPPKKGFTWVYWFGDHQVSEIAKTKIKPFFENFHHFCKGTSSATGIRMKEALQVLSARAGVTFTQEDMASTSSNNVESYDSALASWAHNGFSLKNASHSSSSSNKRNSFAPDPLNPIPPSVACYLPLNPVLHDTLKADDRLQQIVYYDEADNAVDEVVDIPEHKQSQIDRVRRGEVVLPKICVSCLCDAESPKGKDTFALLEHPLFEGGICRLCHDNIKITLYAPGSDFKNSFCTICGQLGKLAICENDYCHRVFCLVCIQLFGGDSEHAKVLESERWECYMCKSLPIGMLKPRVNWRDNIKILFDPIRSGLKLFSFGMYSKRPIRVLSLYDGIASTKVAMEKLGLKIDKYYASEIDKDAMSIAKAYHGESIVHLERVEDISLEKIAEMCPIDIVIGRYPTNELSTITSTNKKGFLENKKIGQLFLYYNHILHLVRLANKGLHVFYLFENFSGINDLQRDVISNLLLCKPVTLNSNDISCQNRNRYLWSNIPGTNRPLPHELMEKLVNLTSVIRFNSALHSSSSSDNQRGDVGDSFDADEVEKLFGFDQDYTNVKGLAKNKRQSLMKKAWCIPLVSHILWPLIDFFETKAKTS